MVFEEKFYQKYEQEHFEPLNGLYSPYDSRILYSVVREIKPKQIVDIGPREGRTTSSIVQALRVNNNGPIDYYLFEKDPGYLSRIVDYLKDYMGLINFHFNCNAIDNQVLSSINNLDLLFIDAFHDHLISRWYIDQLFPKVKSGGVIHIHDIYYNRNNKGWEDVGLGENERPDVWCSQEVLRATYSEDFFNKYYNFDDPFRYEEDEIRDYIVNNKIDFFSTKYESSITGAPEHDNPGNCSIYFRK